MIYKRFADEAADILKQVEEKHGPGWRYGHSVRILGLTGGESTIDLFVANDERMVTVIDGRIQEPM